MSENGNEPAYPTTRHRSDHGDEWTETEEGMTKREAFAMAAMQGLLASGERGDAPYKAVFLADKALAELEKQP